MNILLITQLPPPSGGIATWSMKYLKYCEEHNVNLSVVNNAMIGKRGSDFHAKKNLWTELYRTGKIISELRRKQTECVPDVIHFNTACSPVGVIRDYLCTLFIKKSVPIVLHCRCTVQDQLNNNRAGIFFFRKLASRAALVLVLNRYSEEYVATATKSKVMQVANYIDDEYLRSAEKVIHPKIAKAVFTGHIHQTKGADEIIGAAERLPQIQFFLIGQAERSYQERELPENVILTGNQTSEQVKKYLDEADVYVFPSYTEGFANALTEAMARGLPCIATDAGANRDMLEQLGGVIIPVRDTDALYEALLKLDSPDVRKQMSEWNINKVKNSYLISKVMPFLFSLYREAVRINADSVKRH